MRIVVLGSTCVGGPRAPGRLVIDDERFVRPGRTIAPEPHDFGRLLGALRDFGRVVGVVGVVGRVL
jgi:hypothetical protein